MEEAINMMKNKLKKSVLPRIKQAIMKHCRSAWQSLSQSKHLEDHGYRVCDGINWRVR